MAPYRRARWLRATSPRSSPCGPRGSWRYSGAGAPLVELPPIIRECRLVPIVAQEVSQHNWTRHRSAIARLRRGGSGGEREPARTGLEAKLDQLVGQVRGDRGPAV